MTAAGYLPSGFRAPSGTLSVHRELHDGASYDLTAAAGGVSTLGVRDIDGDTALIAFDRATARRLIDDLELVAGFKPTAAKADRVAAIAGAMRRNLELLAELEKTAPAEVDRILVAALQHLRSWKPQLLLTSEVLP